MSSDMKSMKNDPTAAFIVVVKLGVLENEMKI